ncbi:PIR Superfamily Protein [Plasmodium ovale curtisi]|uniref:PIR Superfamily Protein n=1 Tax=Plasmodium ovale curtisi TaxID=864141 RepID=A0A1A8VL67_PLAOA|nr:PIR Superfamily Protein [Plasmodium ovale curtisi]
MSELCIGRASKNSYDYWDSFFNKSRTIFYNVQSYLEHIQKIKDPILKHIALYLVENYEDAKKDFQKDDRHNVPCSSLNRWLEQRRNFFTSGKECSVNANLWNDTIEKLWDKLFSEKNNNLCKRLPNTSGGYPQVLNSPNCYKHIPSNHISYDPKQPPSICQKRVISSECNYPEKVTSCPKPVPCNCDPAPSLPEPHTSLECNYTGSKELDMITSSGFTFFGTCILFFILSKFTPLISWMYSRQIRGKSVPHYIGEEVTDDILASYSGNYNSHYEERRNNILYQSALN